MPHGKSGLSLTITLIAASVVPAHAQSDWTGAVSADWFTPGNWTGAVPEAGISANIDTTTQNPTVIGPSATPATAQVVTVGVGAPGAGQLSIQGGGSLTSVAGAVGNLTGSRGTVLVSGSGAGVASTWTNIGSLVVGGLGSGSVTVQDGGTLDSRGGSVGQSFGSSGSVTVSGFGSTWNNGPAGGLNVGSFGTGTLTITSGAAVLNNTGFAANIGNGANSKGTVIVTGGGSLWRNSTTLNVGLGGSGSLTLEQGGQVIAVQGVTIAQNAGSTGVLNIGAPEEALPVLRGTLTTPSVTFGAGTGRLVFNHTAPAGDDYNFLPLISGAGRVVVLGGATDLIASNTYTGGTTIGGGSLQIASNANLGQAAGTLEIAGAGTLRIAGDIRMARNTTLGDGGGTLDTQAFDLTMNAPITGQGGLVKLGSGKLVLTADNSYTGLTNIAAGTVQLGNGGSAGAIAGDVLHNGNALIFERSNELTLAGAISGSGSLQQVGSGTTTLSGNSAAFFGSTAVTNGALRINGLLGNALSSMTVSNGGRLGGTGTLGGSVLIGDGVLAPGNSPGRLTINGNLSLAATSVLDYEFGRAGVVGGRFNDLTVVGGDLTLDGTLNLSASADGVFGPGLYRLISYGGTLTDNSLALGTQPDGSVNSVQTAVARQVNLLNTAGLTLDFWDGVATPRHNGQIEGGPGAWQAAGGNDNWTDSTGVVNAPYAAGTFAVFAGTPGTITVDNSLGAVVSRGMQFATSGYVLQGQPITLAPGNNILRVGDGSGPGADYVATMDSELAGAGGINKTDLGTLVLTGINSYSGGTTIGGGTVQIANDANLGATPGPLSFDGGTLRTTAGFTTARATTLLSEGGTIETQSGVLTHNGTLEGAGPLRKTGDGTLILGADNSYTGGTTISSGTLQLGNGGATGSIVGDVNNNAALVFSRSDALTYSGAISGSGTVTKLGGVALTLTGASSYSGGTVLKGGQINVGHSTALGSGTLAMDEGTTLGFASDGLNLANAVVLTGTSDPVIDTGAFTETLSGIVSGGGALTKSGSGTLVLAGANTYAGATVVAAGTLRAGAADAFSAASVHTVAAGATLDTGGFEQRVAALSNNGTVSAIGASGGGALTVTGAYVGNAGILRLGSGGAGAINRLVVDGPTATASGTTSVQIANLDGLGALTSGNGIEVISARNGATTTAQTTRSAFSLADGHVDAGAFEYGLHAADAQGAGENWYLRSTTTVGPPVDPPVDPPVQVPTYRAEVPLLAALPGQVRQADLAMLGNLHRRMGDEAPGSWGGPATQAPSSLAETGTRRAWGRFVYSDLGVEQPGVAQARADLRVSGLQAGTDLLVMDGWRSGVYVGYLDGKADVSGNARGVNADVGSNDLRSRFLGAYATWMDASGWYFDSVLQGASHRYEIQPNGNPSVSGKASGFMASVEGGKAFALTERWSLEPQAQLAWQHNDFDDV
ncbi:MAG TPA: autotransporter outer membrane beta-barrel domain-containing protein, partial [Ramlibacter sp.]|nr:autotransporter outer membrane beta-barrel domain-containing protein [Ramlibacter sp.]